MALKVNVIPKGESHRRKGPEHPLNTSLFFFKWAKKQKILQINGNIINAELYRSSLFYFKYLVEKRLCLLETR